MITKSQRSIFNTRQFVDLRKILLLFAILGLFTLPGYSAQTQPVNPTTTPPTANNNNTQKKTDSAAAIKTLKDQVGKLQKTADSLKISMTSPAKISDDGKGGFNWGIGFICAICGIVTIMLVVLGKSGPRDAKFPFGLPEGSINATIAILAILFYILVSVVFSLMSVTQIATDVTKTLGTLVVAVSAFYFGSKTAEQSNKVATDTLSKLVEKNDGTGEAPPGVIQQAITDNKDNWMKLYGCKNIVGGKKITDNTTHNLNCIVFYVYRKVDFNRGEVLNELEGRQPIPPTISYNYQGKIYNIPTDVQS